MNPKRVVDIALVVAAVLAFLIFRQLTGFLWDTFRLPVNASWVLDYSDLIALVLAVGVYFGVGRLPVVLNFLNEVVIELSKVNWPQRKETLTSAVVVVVMVGISSLVMVFFDGVWAFLTKKFLNI